jgi:integrase/recombinase XerD
MSVPKSSDERDVWLARLADHLKEERYGSCAPHRHLHAKRFLDYLHREDLTVHTVQPPDVARYLNTLKARRHKAVASKGMRITYRSAIHLLLRLVHGRWPLAPIATCERERFRDQLLTEYNAWMKDLRGLSESTRSSRCAEAVRFLEWLGERSASEQLASIAVADIDAYVKWRASSLQRQALLNSHGGQPLPRGSHLSDPVSAEF